MSGWPAESRPRHSHRLKGFAVVAIFAVLLTTSPRPFAAATLPHLHGIDEIRDWFNGGKGHVRLILLLSPT
jgi:hypothetical protein